uniref:Uncharacterized protein n=1 Tax=Nelumbo nucifera TaxID=4432 RepID=A0A822XVW1_NELNU|nr:TPA_asm: hypothetical protein HUJ06_025346 [Nelumbo nucifera]
MLKSLVTIEMEGREGERRSSLRFCSSLYLLGTPSVDNLSSCFENLKNNYGHFSLIIFFCYC